MPTRPRSSDLTRVRAVRRYLVAKGLRHAKALAVIATGDHERITDAFEALSRRLSAAENAGKSLGMAPVVEQLIEAASEATRRGGKSATVTACLAYALTAFLEAKGASPSAARATARHVLAQAARRPSRR